jgi:Flp pilus assembly protein TadG
MVENQRGQAIVETAIVVPLLILLAMVVIAAMVIAIAHLQVNAATSLAAASAASAPIDPVVSRRWAEQTYSGSLNDYGYLRVDPLDATSPNTCRRNSVVDTTIRCHGHATLRFSQTPLVWLGLVEISIDAYAEETAPSRRSR